VSNRFGLSERDFAAAMAGWHQDAQEVYGRENPELLDFLHEEEWEGLDAYHEMIQNADEVDGLARGRMFSNAQNFLLYNPLSSRWTLDKITANPQVMPILYISGMVGFALCLPIRIAIFVVTLMQIIAIFFENLCSGRHTSMKNQLKLYSFISLGALCEIGSALSGTLCPLVGYKLDEKIQSKPSIHAWYSNHYLSFWLFEIYGRQVNPGEVGLGAETISIGNEHRLQILKAELSEYDSFFAKAKRGLSDVVSEEEMDSLSPEVLNKISDLGFFFILSDGKSLNVFKKKALEKCKVGLESAKKSQELDMDLKKFETYWNAVIEAKKAARRLARIPLLGRFFKNNRTRNKSENHKLSRDQLICAVKSEMLLDMPDEYYTEKATRKKLESELAVLEKSFIIVSGEKVSVRAAVKEMVTAIRDFSMNTRTTNREVEVTVTKAAYQ